MTKDLINRISFYLASGGLFNPELADHIAVRTLLFECREALAQPETNLNCKSTQARLATAWGYVKAEQEPVACDGDFPEGFDDSLGVPAQALRVANAIMCDVIGKREWDVPCTAQHVLSFAQKYTTPPQRKPLSDEEKQAMWSRTKVYLTPKRSYFQGIADSEAAHGIKGEA